MESFLCTGITLVNFSIEGKTTEQKEILNISNCWLEMSFLSNFHTLVGILLGPTDSLESNKDMIFSISVLTYKNRNIRSLFQKIRKKFMWEWNIKLPFISNWRKIVVENIWDCHWIGNHSSNPPPRPPLQRGDWVLLICQ